VTHWFNTIGKVIAGEYLDSPRGPAFILLIRTSEYVFYPLVTGSTSDAFPAVWLGGEDATLSGEQIRELIRGKPTPDEYCRGRFP
jgi:hypothetical protein